MSRFFNPNHGYLHNIKSKICKNAFIYMGPKVINALPNDIKQTVKFEEFKHKCKTHFINVGAI